MSAGSFLYSLHVAFQAFAALCRGEPVRYAVSRWKLRRVMRPINKQIEDARRQHKPVKHLLTARQSLLNYGLRRPA